MRGGPVAREQKVQELLGYQMGWMDALDGWAQVGRGFGGVVREGGRKSVFKNLIPLRAQHHPSLENSMWGHFNELVCVDIYDMFYERESFQGRQRSPRRVLPPHRSFPSRGGLVPLWLANGRFQLKHQEQEEEGGGG